jgi:hypothetical protein
MTFRKFIKRLSILVLVITLLGFLYLKFCWIQISSANEMKFNASIVDSIAPLPNNFLKIWDNLYPNSRNNGMNKQLWSEITRELGSKKKYNNCYCDEIGYTAWNNDNLHFKFNLNKLIGNYRKFGYGLEYYTTPAKCFDFWINNDILWDGKYLRNLNELSLINFKKNIEQLNDIEITELIIYRKLGDSIKNNKSRFTEALRSLLAKLQAE